MDEKMRRDQKELCEISLLIDLNDKQWLYRTDASECPEKNSERRLQRVEQILEESNFL